MKIRDTVFGSQSEYKLYEALRRQWKDFDIYPSLPFLSIIEVEEADVIARTLGRSEWDFLKKTSIDFTLCERLTHRPLLSIDFDGLGHGFSHFPAGVSIPQYVATVPTRDQYRKLKFDLKLRICGELAYHYLVVSYDEAYPIEEELGLTVLDGIIGYILSRNRFQELLLERKFEIEGNAANEDYVQDWIVGLEVEAEIESNPICRESSILEDKLWKLGILKGVRYTPLEQPPSPTLKDLLDAETIQNRVKALRNASTRHGAEVSFQTSSGEVKERVFVRNIEWGLSSIISRNMAELLALKKIARNLNIS